MFAVIPLQCSQQAKSRLATTLARSEREALFAAMARHVIETCLSSTRLSGVVVVTRDDAMTRQAVACGAEVLRDHGEGTAAACNHAMALLSGRIDAGVLMVSGDLPLLQPLDIDAMCAAATTHGVAIAPDRAGMGTNALCCLPGGTITACFGEHSFARHRDQARHLVVRRPGLALDIDVGSDLQFLRRGIANGAPVASDIRRIVMAAPPPAGGGADQPQRAAC